MQLVNEVNGEPLPDIKCTLCGLALYATDRGSYEITYHCSSSEARFWDFDRGTRAQHLAKEHWDQSLREVFFTRGEEDTRAEKVA